MKFDKSKSCLGDEKFHMASCRFVFLLVCHVGLKDLNAKCNFNSSLKLTNINLIDDFHKLSF